MSLLLRRSLLLPARRRLVTSSGAGKTSPPSKEPPLPSIPDATTFFKMVGFAHTPFLLQSTLLTAELAHAVQSGALAGPVQCSLLGSRWWCGALFQRVPDLDGVLGRTDWLKSSESQRGA